MGTPSEGEHADDVSGITWGPGAGVVYNTPELGSYEGWYVSGSFNLGGGISGLAGSFFWSPTPTYAIRPNDPNKKPLLNLNDVKKYCTDCEYRYSHGFKGALGRGISVSISLTYSVLFETILDATIEPFLPPPRGGV